MKKIFLIKSLYFAVFWGSLSAFLRSDIVPTQVTTTLFTDYTTSWIANDGGIPNPQQERKPFAQDEGRTVISPNRQPSHPGWKLVWKENFDKDGVIDEAVWSKIPRGSPDWQRNMSGYEALYDVKNGNLILCGIVNPGLPDDSNFPAARYATGRLMGRRSEPG